MIFRKAVCGVCLMLVLAVQFLVAQHASVHPVEVEQGGYSALVHHDHDGDRHSEPHHHNDGCGLCDFIKIVSYSISGFIPAFAVFIPFAFIAYSGTIPFVRMQRTRIASYYSQAPPTHSFLTI